MTSLCTSNTILVYRILFSQSIYIFGDNFIVRNAPPFFPFALPVSHRHYYVCRKVKRLYFRFLINMLLILFLTVFMPSVFSRFCVDDQVGWCRGHEIWGWCFHNKTSGRFNCDEDGFCIGQEQLKNKKSTGCFQRDNNTVCCCNDADGCNLGFIPVSPKYAAGQSCVNQMEEPNDIKIYKPCDDPWCFAFLSADAEGGLTTVHRGCHSRKTVMHYIYKDQDKKFNNSTKWQDTEILVAQPSCADITWEAEYLNGTQSMCLDFSFEEDGVERKGRLCCCRGTNKCNERFMWSDEAINKETLAEIILRRDQTTGGQSTLPHLATILFSYTLVLRYHL